MAKVWIEEFACPDVVKNGQMLQAGAQPSLTTQVVALDVTSTQSLAFNPSTRFVRVHTDAICSFAIGADPTATANSSRMPADSTEYFSVVPGHKIAIITNV